ncbi:DUF255 domain-containing protein [Nannocystis sp.]|uniref:DUF255 domain-containing protein n=1 Tax=Nannocystis sp. TaxID=1962667 RepID=UPI0025D29206|nr:DUF255 domain-containing protein [Nannocystis sp.]MBK7830227.1 DUF255 domain-containing protein [Nannocystis sp.]
MSRPCSLLARLSPALLALALSHACAAAPPLTASTPAPAAASFTWHEWRPESFASAARERRILLVNVAASWCHWCHVMDHRTYADPQVAALLRDHFMPIRVDADARPDLAERYAEWGWPATAVLTSDARPVLELRGFQEPAEFAALLRKLVAEQAAGSLQGRRPGPRARTREHRPRRPAPRRLGPARRRLRPRARRLGSRPEVPAGRARRARPAARPGLRRPRMAGPRAHHDRRGDPAHRPGVGRHVPVLGRRRVGPAPLREDRRHPGRRARVPRPRPPPQPRAPLAQRRPPPAQLHPRHDAAPGRRFLHQPGRRPPAPDAEPVPGPEYYARGDADRRKLGIPRVDPHRYADINARTISALCQLHASVPGPDGGPDNDALAAALQAGERLLSAHREPGGGFRHDADLPGPLHLRDQAAVGRALLALHRVTGDERWLVHALDLASSCAPPRRSRARRLLRPHPRPGAVGVFAERRKPIEDNGMAARFLLELHRQIDHLPAPSSHADAAIRPCAPCPTRRRSPTRAACSASTPSPSPRRPSPRRRHDRRPARRPGPRRPAPRRPRPRRSTHPRQRQPARRPLPRHRRRRGLPLHRQRLLPTDQGPGQARRRRRELPRHRPVTRQRRSSRTTPSCELCVNASQ